VLPPTIHLALEKVGDPLRYGENPHQQGARYREIGKSSWWDGVTQHGGIALSYLNLFDAEAAWQLVHDLGDRPAAAVIKHANPCGAAVADDIGDAYTKAFSCDPVSAFGGIVALNRPVDLELAEELVANPKADVLIAPSFTDDALDLITTKKKNLRVLSAPSPNRDPLELRRVGGGFLVQDADRFVSPRSDWRVVTKAAPTEEQWLDLEIAWRICGWVKSNAIVLVKDGVAVGIGAGQQNRKDSGRIAAEKAAGRAVGGACASDAFYPFRDGLDAAAEAGAAAVVQPGGSLRDDEVIAAADEHGVAMVFTGERHFRH
jgi:phosphoribosylaminoimidazolecarboxamide formyltransferase/IMP cyclohydrolase